MRDEEVHFAMEEMTLCAPEHQEVFRRVWERVMGGQADCPIQAAPEEPPEGRLSQPPPPAEAPAAAQPTPAPCLVPLCLHIRQLLEGRQCYRQLARRTRGAAGALSALAADVHRQARQLAAAYFLRTGVRYWPAGALSVQTPPSLWGALRQRHRAEEQFRQACLEAARSGEDQDLAQLYTALAQDCLAHCRQLCALLERLGP